MNLRQINQLFDRIWERRIPFLMVFFCAVLVTYLVLFVIDFIPEPVLEEETEESVVEEAVTISEPEVVEEVLVDPYPVRIIFDSLDKELPVLNPNSSTVADLDAALLSGVVRHPESADFNVEGNIFILGHSSYLPNVFNKNFQAFNGIQELIWGDTVRLQSGEYEYTYRVDKTYEAKASEVVVPETPGKAKLTLATCNSFGTKDDRFIVEATLIATKPL